MKTIAKRLALVLCIFTLGFVTGCGTAGKPPADAALVQKVLNDLLPPDFVGPIALKHENEYFTVDIQAGNVRRVGDHWTWDWLRYSRNSHFPIFSGLTWRSAGVMSLGAPPAGNPPSNVGPLP